MLIIPAIDLKNGHCVRLAQGRMDEETVYSHDPVEMAGKWISKGAQRLHIVDLDGAVRGEPMNMDIIREIAKAHPNISIQVGGGIRTEATIEAYLELGVDYIILGTRAVNNPEFVSDVCAKYSTHIITGFDSRNGKLATNGWEQMSSCSPVDMARRYKDYGVSAIIFTDIARDGMLSKVNIPATLEICDEVDIPVIASGGLHNLDDIRMLCEVAHRGIAGVIAGRAIYSGTLDLSEAQAMADEFFKGHKE
ncbi:MAG: 1-(5-phosphoribosyl)-5-[(5-phosphoribosylamino)methylideneamino]imidazole-4-carboxamide isomerase [Candidatus Eutrophobiaceae bacterium]